MSGMRIAFIVIALLLPLAILADDSATGTSPIEKARILLNANKPEDALDVLSAYQPTSRELSAYHSLFAQSLVQMKKPAESIEHFRIAYIYAATTAEKERLLLDRAETYKKMTYYSEAMVCYRNFLKNFPQSSFMPRAELGLADSLYQLGNFHEAIESYEKAGETVQALLGKANAVHKLGNYKKANDLYMALLARDKKFVESSQEALFNIGENFREMGRLLDAKIYLNSIKDPDLQLSAYAGLGLIAKEEKKYPAAEKYFTEVLTTKDRKLHQQALLHLATTYLAWGKQEEGLNNLLEIRRNYPYGKEYDTALLLLAKMYRNQGKPESAVPFLNELVCRRTPVPAALEEIESLLIEMKDKNNAELANVWRVAGHWLLEPSRAQSVVKIARALRHSGKIYLDICRWLIKNGSEETKAQGRLLLADFYADIGEAAIASQYAKRGKKLATEDDALRTQARVLFVNGAYQETLATLKNIKEMKEPDVQLLLDVARSLPDPGQAVVFCNNLFSKNQWSPTAQVMFADFLFDQGKKQEALGHYAAVASLKIDNKQNSAVLADIEWACYRVSLLAPASQASDALAKIKMVKSALGRLAGADLQGRSISERIP